MDALCAHARTLGVSLRDTLSTATRFTAECIREGVERFCPQRPERLIVGGGGSMNPVLLAHIADCLPGCQVLTNEQLGLDSSAKEAVAFAVLANEALYGCANNAPGATGAAHGVVMGKNSACEHGPKRRRSEMTNIEVRTQNIYENLSNAEKKGLASYFPG